MLQLNEDFVNQSERKNGTQFPMNIIRSLNFLSFCHRDKIT